MRGGGQPIASGSGRGSRGGHVVRGGRVARVFVDGPPSGYAHASSTRQSVVYCPYCGNRNLRSQNCCGNCGVEIFHPKICRQCLMPEPEDANWTYCLRCGNRKLPEEQPAALQE